MPQTTGNLGAEIPVQNLIEVQWAIEPASWMPQDCDIEGWALEVLRSLDKTGTAHEVCIRLVSKQEIRILNRDFRHVDKTTNVLAFPQAVELDDGRCLLGDIVICAPVVEAESKAQGKALTAHYAHLVVHGMLHLLGFDHLVETEAEEMERMEIDILKSFGVNDPYDEARIPNPKKTR